MSTSTQNFVQSPEQPKSNPPKSFWGNGNFMRSTPMRFYKGIVCLAAVYGGLRGLWDWTEWLDNRNRVPVKYGPCEPIVNTARDAGFMVWNVGLSSSVSALVAATAPVSVPLLMRYSGDSNKQSTDKSNTH